MRTGEASKFCSGRIHPGKSNEIAFSLFENPGVRKNFTLLA